MLDLPKDEREPRAEPVCEDMQFQRRNWIAERISWSLMAGFSFVALVGVFDGERLTASSPPSHIRVEYWSPVRTGTETELRIAGLSAEATVELPLGHKVIRSVPTPVVVSREGERQSLKFAATTPGEIALTIQPNGVGSMRGHVSAAGQRVSFDQFILP